MSTLNESRERWYVGKVCCAFSELPREQEGKQKRVLAHVPSLLPHTTVPISFYHVLILRLPS